MTIDDIIGNNMSFIVSCKITYNKNIFVFSSSIYSFGIWKLLINK
jgi:hypothetical protein